MGWRVTKPYVATLILWSLAVLLFTGSNQALDSGKISSDTEIAVNTLALALLAGWLVWMRVGLWQGEPVIKPVLEGFITMPAWVKLLFGGLCAVAGVLLGMINHPYGGLLLAVGVFFILFEVFIRRTPASEDETRDDDEKAQHDV